MRLPCVPDAGSNVAAGSGQSAIPRSLSGTTLFLLCLPRSYLLLTTSYVPQTLISLPMSSLLIVTATLWVGIAASPILQTRN